MATRTHALPSLTAPVTGLSLDVAMSGPAIPPIERLRFMNPKDWTDFVLEWVDSLKRKYARVERCDGAGDMGRDIVASESLAQDDPWDNYQCKHYDHPLMPTDIWEELGKLAFHTFNREYSLPRHYVFVAPQAAGNALSRLLRKPDKLRDELFGAWDRYCRKNITQTGEVVLSSKLKDHIKAMNFGIFGVVPPLTLIVEHSRTPWHVARFGMGLPPRADAPSPPATISAGETNYVRALLDAYEDRLGIPLGGTDDLGDAGLRSHFSRSRIEFYSAESLREFSRDNVPGGTFERLLDQVYDGVMDVVQAGHKDAYERVLSTVKQAKLLQLNENILVARTRPADRGGMCHQLANELKLKWRQ